MCESTEYTQTHACTHTFICTYIHTNTQTVQSHIYTFICTYTGTCAHTVFYRLIAMP